MENTMINLGTDENNAFLIAIIYMMVKNNKLENL